MNDLKQAVLEYAKRYVDDKNDWYDCKINEGYLPMCIELPEGNAFKKTLPLNTH